MAVEMLDDDVFFAELSKQISLLITDEDDADVAAAAQFIPNVAAPLPVSHRPLAPRSVPSGHQPSRHVWSHTSQLRPAILLLGGWEGLPGWFLLELLGPGC
jgi:hypothetical protein